MKWGQWWTHEAGKAATQKQSRSLLIKQGSQHFKQTQFTDISRIFSWIFFPQNSRIIILTYFQFQTIFDAIAENSSCYEHGETNDTSKYCVYTSVYWVLLYYYYTCRHVMASHLPSQPSSPHIICPHEHNIWEWIYIRMAASSLRPIKFLDLSVLSFFSDSRIFPISEWKKYISFSRVSLNSRLAGNPVTYMVT